MTPSQLAATSELKSARAEYWGFLAEEFPDLGKRHQRRPYSEIIRDQKRALVRLRNARVSHDLAMKKTVTSNNAKQD